MDLKSQIEETIANYWLEENKYCGISALQIWKKLNGSNSASEEDIKELILGMETEELLSTREIESGDRVSYAWDGNKLLKNIDPGPHVDLWAYPKRNLLVKYDNASVEDVGYYTKQLRLGGSQIEHRFFQRQVLERYRDDPRYVFEERSSSGYLCIKDEHFLDENFPEEDKVTIQDFGIGYDQNDNEIVAVILSDLGALSLSHQAYWSSYEIKEKCKLDADYVETHFEARFTDRVSIFRAFRQELEEINKICEMMGEPHLFIDDFDGKVPSKFGLLSKPTDGEYYEFVQVLDKMLSDNINKKFFKGKIELTDEQEIELGKIKVTDKGTIRLLDEYLNTNWNFPDLAPKNEMIDTMKDVRRQRQIPAHKIAVDNYDLSNNEKQKELMIKAFRALHILRTILAHHPQATKYEPPKWLEEGRII